MHEDDVIDDVKGLKDDGFIHDEQIPYFRVIVILCCD
jgi:hypothetical protein